MSEYKYITDNNGEKTAIILPIKKYEEILEDLHDLAIIAERKDEPTIKFEDIKERLKRDGFL